ncbi:MAG TPA: Gfo/Idh/MocA family oxidoreductase [Cyclobacteriaceae bacterium]|nr:Gfo/Idh/MocA family oxidoreductase [Cyclobacteriaceae bacterium]HMV07609.1 Gfo/Idh/MocA family oxidoreductase [Cyclobacteriaceae bacterium]HMV89338.1 Gfo/Idh/MocA family oxidoreductase [Cyclobacteriaceae bacterium]HMW98744.1 Gfo/Idh/MocA family oxidoreductase [Cyclobacteriaceae bacterium]HMX48623.1 Gfo/Idh/MocA family oxidoreductase [Cyclobacteriaceae bacterium]
MSKFSRRDALRLLGLSAAATALPTALEARNEFGQPILLPENKTYKKLDKPVTAIVCGAGNRGNVYGGYSLAYPDNLDIIGVAEPIAIRNERYAKKHAIKDENRFVTWEDVFKRPKFADAIIISTPDNLHYGPCMKALEMGYDVLLEKPISPSEKECRDILALAKKNDRIVAVCHVLRYAPYFVKLRELIQSKAIGEVISIQHMEPIEHFHMSHSYVRGNWHNSRQTTPIILAKSCHDLDILRWMIGKPSKSIHAFGDLSWFTKKNAPAGSTERCTDGCAVEGTCPYSALEVYYRRREWNYVFDLPEDKDKQSAYVLEQLKTTNYGRCVYRMDNDQPDHYVTNILFDDNVTASFSMEALTSYGGRRTRVMGSHGDIVGDMNSFTITNFRSGKKEEWKEATDGHGGGDWRLAENWVQAVAQRNPALLTSTIDQSIESHVMGFMAEESRKNKKVMDIRM